LGGEQALNTAHISIDFVSRDPQTDRESMVGRKRMCSCHAWAVSAKANPAYLPNRLIIDLLTDNEAAL
jgi:hypothetical protein